MDEMILQAVREARGRFLSVPAGRRYFVCAGCSEPREVYPECCGGVWVGGYVWHVCSTCVAIALTPAESTRV